MTNLIITEKLWYAHMAERLQQKLGGNWAQLSRRQEFTLENLRQLKPQYVFVPHWSYFIPEEIFNNFECIVFHMTDLPYGRGGSPLQNLIKRGHKETKISALRVTQELDAGDIYLKAPLQLLGTADEILTRSARVIETMIEAIVKSSIKPSPQSGEVTIFKRRTPNDSLITDELETLENIYDHIRMLDGEGYPKAFLETKNYSIEFSSASLHSDSIEAKVIIKRRE